jgi:hypothetical protein
LLSVVALAPRESIVAGASPAPEVNADESGCEAAAMHSVAPEAVIVGSRAELTLHAKVLCAGERFPMHIALVLDGGSQMFGTPNRRLKQGAADLVRGLNLGENSETKVGVVVFSHVADARAELTRDEATILAAIDSVAAIGGTEVDTGIREGIQLLKRGRPNPNSGSSINEVLVLMSNGRNSDGCSPVTRAASEAKRDGMLVVTVCITNDCNSQCMRAAASYSRRTRYHYDVQDIDEIIAAFETIRERMIQVAPRSLTVTNTLSAALTYVPGSAQPLPSSVGDDRRALNWRFSRAPGRGVTVTFLADVLLPGNHAVSDAASGSFVDDLGRSGRFEFPIPDLQIVPEVTATPTLEPTPTPTAGPEPAYLPIAYDGTD